MVFRFAVAKNNPASGSQQYERVEKPNLYIIKKDSSRELYDRDKLTIAIRHQSISFESEVEILTRLLQK